MSALPPEDAPPGFREAPVVLIHHHDEEEPTGSELAETAATFFAVNLLGLVLAAAIVTYTWNALRSGSTLPDFDFNQAFAGVVILRVLALTIRL